MFVLYDIVQQGRTVWDFHRLSLETRTDARHALDVKMAAARGLTKLYGIGLHAIRQNTTLKATTFLQQRAFRVNVSLMCTTIASSPLNGLLSLAKVANQMYELCSCANLKTLV